jgi:hypothetical protein
MDPIVFRQARRKIEGSGLSLTKWLGLTADILYQWETGTVKIPRRRASQIRWLLRLADNRERLKASGLAECTWEGPSDLPDPASTADPDELLRGLAEYERQVEDHEKSCPICTERKAWTESHLETLPPFPAGTLGTRLLEGLGRLAGTSEGPSLRGDLAVSIGLAVLLSGFVLVVFVVAGVATLLGATVGGWNQMPRGLIFIFASYLLAAIIGGVALWATRPLRRWMLGWIATGIVLATIIYTAVALSGIVGYVYFDVNLLEFESEAEAWRLLLPSSLLIGLLAGIPAGLFFWYKEGRG